MSDGVHGMAASGGKGTCKRNEPYHLYQRTVRFYCYGKLKDVGDEVSLWARGTMFYHREAACTPQARKRQKVFSENIHRKDLFKPTLKDTISAV